MYAKYIGRKTIIVQQSVHVNPQARSWPGGTPAFHPNLAESVSALVPGVPLMALATRVLEVNAFGKD